MACTGRVTAPSSPAPRWLTPTSSRFPVISGFRVVWDSRRPRGQRVLSIHLDPEISESTTDTPSLTPGVAAPAKSEVADITHGLADEVKREKGGRMYRVVTREYLASGHDGYDMLKGNKYLIEDEGGQMISAVVRKYLLGESRIGTFPQLRLKQVTLCRSTVRKSNVPSGEREHSL